MKCEIEKVENGFIFSYDIEEDENKIIKIKKIFADQDTQESEKESFTNLIYELAEYFGFPYNKFLDGNLNIKWNKKGHKL